MFFSGSAYDGRILSGHDGSLPDDLPTFKNDNKLSSGLDNKLSSGLDNKLSSGLLSRSKNLSHSEFNMSKLKGHQKKLSRSSTSLNYDADIEYDSEPELVVLPEWDWELRCDMCGLEYGSPFESTFSCSENYAQSPTRERKTKRRFFHKRAKVDKCNPFNPIVGGVNLEEFKDASYKMDKFDASSERTWTLQYTIDSQPKLSKIIIGRGCRNEFPELNSIHLISETKSSKTSDWRNDIHRMLQVRNNDVKDNFNLLATNETCLFCLYEQNIEVNNAVRNNRTLCKTIKETNAAETQDLVDGKLVPSCTLSTDDVQETKSTVNSSIIKLFAKIKAKKEFKENDDEAFTII